MDVLVGTVERRRQRLHGDLTTTTTRELRLSQSLLQQSTRGSTLETLPNLR